jgi:Putative lumazine-binding
MKLIPTLASLIIACFWANLALAQHTSDEFAAITKTLNYYIEGGTNRDSATFAKAFFPNGQMMFVRNDSVQIISLKDFVAGTKPGEKLKRNCRITNIQIFGNAATARLELIYETHTFVDFMNLLKTKEGWKIVNKIFYREEKAKEPAAQGSK